MKIFIKLLILATILIVGALLGLRFDGLFLVILWLGIGIFFFNDW